MFEERLEIIARRLQDVRLVALVAADGIPVEVHSGDDELDVDVLAAELLTQVRSIADNHGDLAMGSVRQLSIVTEQKTLMLGALAGGYYLLVVLGGAASFGRARFELRRAPLAFDSDLE
jgi:predicted regulator of Ras-like GTPase activity (Roadblock/LC7/MglB family)